MGGASGMLKHGMSRQASHHYPLESEMYIPKLLKQSVLAAGMAAFAGVATAQVVYSK
jgi:hypothetical protein